MTRSVFFSGILASLGVAGAPANTRVDVCPVCRTKAEPYRRPTARICRDGESTFICGGIAFDDVQTVPFGDKERVTRCKNCNAAFWQDAEK